MGPKLPGRPPAPIHKLYKRVEGSKPTDPKFSCIGCEEELRGKELVKLCLHSYHCKGLTEADKQFASTCADGLEKQKQLKALGEEPGTSGSDSSRASSAGNKRRAGVQSGALDSHVDRVRQFCSQGLNTLAKEDEETTVAHASLLQFSICRACQRRK
jgi:hypothetical protein